MTKNIGFIILLSFISSFSFAQKKNAYGSEKGIYLLNTLHAANKKNPYKGASAYVIERSVAGQNNFQKIAAYSTPISSNEFIERANNFQDKFAYTTDINQEELLNAWLAFEKIKSWDSLKHHLSFTAVQAGFGVLLLDETANKNTKYVYKISSVDDNGKTIQSFTTNEVSYPEMMTYRKPKYVKQTTDGIAATIIWKTIKDRKPHHFKVFRSEGERGTMKEYGVAKNIYEKKDTFFYAFTDEKMNKGTMYRYCISPSNNYGNYNIHSDTILATNLLAKDADLPTDLKAVSMDSLEAIKISWQIPNAAELDAVEIYRGIDYEKPFQKIMSVSPTQNQYVDKTIATGQRYFYTLKVIDRLGRSTISTNKVFAICSGKQKHLPPLRVLAKPTNKGIQLYWIPNGENIRGFYLYRCEGIDGDFKQLGNFISYKKDSMPNYLDADKNMTTGATYSYEVKEESNGHILSDACKPTITQAIHGNKNLQMPMTILSATSIDKGFLLSWNFNSSVNGIYGTELLRKKSDEKTFTKINKLALSLSIQSFVDSSIEQNVAYQYQLIFLDNINDKVGKTNVVEVKKENLNLASPFNLKGSFENNVVKLSWEYASKNATDFKIYRRTPGKKPEQIGSVKNSSLTYTDSKLSGDEVVFYYIVAANKNAESQASNEWHLVK
ncbi:MAG: hypothetical protein RJA07_2811 [Bacteroidota bacterium]|jgi:fibronectin type 3 domain-containing protein